MVTNIAGANVKQGQELVPYTPPAASVDTQLGSPVPESGSSGVAGFSRKFVMLAWRQVDHIDGQNIADELRVSSRGYNLQRFGYFFVEVDLKETAENSRWSVNNFQMTPSTGLNDLSVFLEPELQFIIPSIKRELYSPFS